MGPTLPHDPHSRVEGKGGPLGAYTATHIAVWKERGAYLGPTLRPT